MARNGRPPLGLKLTEAEREDLLARLGAHEGAADEKFRIRIVLALAQGESGSVIAKRLSTTAQTISKWRKRFESFRIAGLSDAPRPGPARRVSDEQVQAVIDRVRQTKPVNATHWSVRQMGAAVGVSASTVHRIWRAFALTPHLQDTFSRSTDPHVVEKARDVVGLYMNPPDRAMVLCVDETSQIQALNRAQPGLPLTSGQPATRRHDHKRRGTTSLFAALDVATGKVIGQLKRRHLSAEFLQFLNAIDASVPADTELHLIMDNYGTPKTQAVRAWFTRHPRFHLHFTPTSTAWMNLVERFSALINQRHIKRGANTGVKDLEASIAHYIDTCDRDPRPFVWTSSAAAILGSIERPEGKTNNDAN